MQPLLFLGSRDQAVLALVEQLRAQGFWQDDPPRSFDRELEGQVKYFQQTHLGPDGKFLVVDGVVGEKTWWALSHPVGAAQRSKIVATLPAGLSPKRAQILQVGLQEHAKNVCEQPNGSNRGPDIDKYLPDWHRGFGRGPPWCCFFYSWVTKQALGNWPLGSGEGSCARARKRAVERGLWTPKSVPGNHPYPGDAFVMDHHGRGGHIGFVLRVSQDGARINTIEGNCGNRVKVGLRSLADNEIVGFIDNVSAEAPSDFERGVLEAENLGGSQTT